MTNIIKIDGEILLGKKISPSGEFKDWLIQFGCDINKYVMIGMPSFEFFYLLENKVQSRITSVEQYIITNKIIKEIENNSSFIFIYNDNHSINNNIIRIKPVIYGKEYKRLIREKKLNRVMNETIE